MYQHNTVHYTAAQVIAVQARDDAHKRERLIRDLIQTALLSTDAEVRHLARLVKAELDGR